jgi:hypothetical protein
MNGYNQALLEKLSRETHYKTLNVSQGKGMGAFMEGQADLLTQALPPILSSIGGFFVLLFFGYGKEKKERKIMSAALLVLLIWTAHVCVILAGEKLTMFSPFITVLCLLLSVIVFSVVFLFNLRREAVSEALQILLFVLGILFSVLGFSNYFGMKDRVVISVSSNFCEDDIKLTRGDGTTMHAVRKSSFLGETGFVINSGDVKEMKYISIECSGKTERKNPLIAFNKSSRGLGVEYVFYKN